MSAEILTANPDGGDYSVTTMDDAMITRMLHVTMEYARDLVATTGPQAVTTTKRQLATDLLRHDPAASVIDANRLLDEAMGTEEYTEGIAAFTERRPPNF